jgi:hypothetical protein
MIRLQKVKVHKKKEGKTTKFRNFQALRPQSCKTIPSLQPDALQVGQLILLKTNGIERISSHESKPGIENPNCSGFKGKYGGNRNDALARAIHACPLVSLDAH